MIAYLNCGIVRLTLSTCRLHVTRPVPAANTSRPLLQCNYINCGGNASSATAAAAVPPSSEAAAPGPGATGSALAPESAATLQPAAAPASAPGPSSGSARSAPAGGSPKSQDWWPQLSSSCWLKAALSQDSHERGIIVLSQRGMRPVTHVGAWCQLRQLMNQHM